MSDKTVVCANGGGVAFLGHLTILFIGLKLTGHIAWSWLWVLAPLWILVAVALVMFCVAGLLTALDSR